MSGATGFKAGAERGRQRGNGGDEAGTDWPEPDMGVMRQNRRPPPPLPLAVFGPHWAKWIDTAAEAAA